MVTHLKYDEATINEVLAGIRAHWDGLFVFGAPDVMVVNVTKEAIWARRAVLPEDGGMVTPNFAKLFGEGGKLPKEIVVPQPRLPREQQQEQQTRDNEIDPKKYMPEDVSRDLIAKLPDPIKFDVEKMMAARGKAPGEKK